MPGFEFAAWIGVMVSAGTPKPLVDRITAAVDKALQTADAREKLAGIGLDVNYLRAEEMALYLKKQSAQVADIIKKANIRIE
jgi:tripartite-type tricarboxylate transporter receptor subunit TctC